MHIHVAVPRIAPDLDGVACAVAYAELLLAQSIPARTWVVGEPDPEARFAIQQLGATLEHDAPVEDCAFVLVDASDMRGVPPSLDPTRVVEVIDHRLHHRAAELFPHAALCIEPVGARRPWWPSATSRWACARRQSRAGITQPFNSEM